MRRAITIVPVLAVVGALMLVLGQPQTVFSKNTCRDRMFKNGTLTDRSYVCVADVESDGTGVPMTLDFHTAGAPPEDFTVVINGSVTGTCACQTKGTTLEQSKKFRCIMDNFSIGDNTSVGDFDAVNSTIEGKPVNKPTKPGKIKNGQGVDEFGTSIVYSCEEALD